MKRITALKTITLAVIAVLAMSCSDSRPLVDETVMLAYGKNPSTENLNNLANNYGTVINKCRKTGIKEPGIYSDYAVALVKQGKRAEANNWFNKEMDAFPSSRGYVMQLKRQLIPEYQDDNSIKDNDASVNNEESALSPAKRAAAEKRASTVMEETNKSLGSEVDDEDNQTENEEEKAETEKESETETETEANE
ncbi:MAG: DUF4810 domain-containing protein [Bacteroidales bacterium]|nr:DUF4810 domain-containing protein [Bacteroidales bacterium]